MAPSIDGSNNQDMTKRKLEDASQRLNTVALKAISQGVIVTTTDLCIVSMNTAFGVITGYTEAEVLGRNCRFLQGPDTNHQTVEAIRLALLQHEGFEGKILNYRKDGSPFWNALTISPVFDQQGGLTHFVGVTRDITESMHAHDALEKSYADLQRTSEMLMHTGALAKVGGWEVNLSSMKLTWTRETFRIAGIESSIEPPLAEGINLFAPEARATISAAVNAAIDHGTPYDLELPIIAVNGQRKWVRTQGSAEMRDGKAIRILGTFQDISEQIAAQAAVHEADVFVRTVVDTVPGMLAYWDSDLTCRFANSAYLSWFGRTSLEMTGLSMKAFLGDALFQKNEHFVRAALSGENQQFERELTMANGDIRHTFAQYIAHWKDGKVQGFLALVTDISEVKKTQESLARSLKEQQALLMEVHHRVKNNLQVITSLLRLEAGRSTVADTKSVLADIGGRIYAMAQLHESLYRSGTFASVDFGAYLGQLATRVFQTHDVARGLVRLTLNLGSVRVGMDQATSGGLLLNELITNCIKHGFPDGRSGEIGVTLQPAADGQDTDRRWCLCVSDTGMGLPADFEERRKASLGMLLVGDLSKQLGGALKIDSVADKGAKFTVVFAVQDPTPLVMPI